MTSNDAFGNKVDSDPKNNNPWRYCGEYFDKETGTVYLRARYYNPSFGRFISRDSYTGEEVNPLSLNLYSYCHNDGVNNVDPTGHWTGHYSDQVKAYVNVHEEITKRAISRIKIKGKKIDEKYRNIIVEFSTYVDEQAEIYRNLSKTQQKKEQKKNSLLYEYSKGRWHGSLYNKTSGEFVAADHINRGIKRARKRKGSHKYSTIGKYIHGVQDAFAHNFGGDLKRKTKDKEYINKRKIYHCNKGSIPVKLSDGQKYHNAVLDNYRWDFVYKNGEWNWKRISEDADPYTENSRVSRAVKESKKFIIKCLDKKKPLYKKSNFYMK